MVLSALERGVPARDNGHEGPPPKTDSTQVLHSERRQRRSQRSRVLSPAVPTVGGPHRPLRASERRTSGIASASCSAQIRISQLRGGDAETADGWWRDASISASCTLWNRRTGSLRRTHPLPRGVTSLVVARIGVSIQSPDAFRAVDPSRPCVQTTSFLPSRIIRLMNAR